MVGNTGDSGVTSPFLPKGTFAWPYKKTAVLEKSSSDGEKRVYFRCITAMEEFLDKSLEELRYEDYQDSRCGIVPVPVPAFPPAHFPVRTNPASRTSIEVSADEGAVVMVRADGSLRVEVGTATFGAWARQVLEVGCGGQVMVRLLPAGQGVDAAGGGAWAFPAPTPSPAPLGGIFGLQQAQQQPGAAPVPGGSSLMAVFGSSATPAPAAPPIGSSTPIAAATPFDGAPIAPATAPFGAPTAPATAPLDAPTAPATVPLDAPTAPLAAPSKPPTTPAAGPFGVAHPLPSFGGGHGGISPTFTFSPLPSTTVPTLAALSLPLPSPASSALPAAVPAAAAPPATAPAPQRLQRLQPGLQLYTAPTNATSPAPPAPGVAVVPALSVEKQPQQEQKAGGTNGQLGEQAQGEQAQREEDSGEEVQDVGVEDAMTKLPTPSSAPSSQQARGEVAAQVQEGEQQEGWESEEMMDVGGEVIEPREWLQVQEKVQGGMEGVAGEEVQPHAEAAPGAGGDEGAAANVPGGSGGGDTGNKEHGD